MNVQVLPNWFKRIALIVFIVSVCLAGADDFMAGWNDYENGKALGYNSSNHNNYYYTNMIGGKQITHWFNILASVALLAYMFSKEKIEDDYIKLLRLQAYQLSFIIITLIALVFYVFNKAFFFGVTDTVNLLMLVFLIVFFFKKRFA